MADTDGGGAPWVAINIGGPRQLETDTPSEDRTRAETLLAGENRLLEMIARGDSLPLILDRLCRLVEEISTGFLATILLLDHTDNRLWHKAAPSLPRSYTEGIDGIVIGPREGSCGTAAYRNAPVIVSDITADPLWTDYRDLPLSHGLRASWSMPVRSSDGSVLGTFAMYAREPRIPDPEHYQLIEQIARLASIAIERTRTVTALQESEARFRCMAEREFRQIVEAIPAFILVLSPEGHPVYANQTLLAYTGLTVDDVAAKDFRDRIFHPEDLERIQNERRQALARGAPFALEQRARRRDGQYRWFLIRFNPLRDEQGKILRWYATATDIDDRKQQEERVHKENIALRDEVDTASMFEEIVGASPALRAVLDRVVRVAPTDSTVLLAGETGTGKELIARAIHKRSARSTHAFVSVNCAAVPQSLIASELFGHEKGAFTGAVQRRLGRFELAEGGTLFLDEVGELPAETQLALLRVLQEREFERVGGDKPIRTDVRVIAATNRDLPAAIAAGTFRSDLYYRLNVFPIQIPSLRQRQSDIPVLVEYFIGRYAGKMGKKISRIDKRTLDRLHSYPWPGNVRELQNVIERSVILCDTERFSIDEHWLSSQPVLATERPALNERLVADERALIEAALLETKGRVSGPLGAAGTLGIPPSTLDSKIKALKIDKQRFRRG